MKALTIIDGRVDHMPGCWTCGRQAVVPPDAREWHSVAQLLETAGWKTRLYADFLDQEQRIVELYQLWCPSCEEGSGEPIKSEPSGLLGCLYRMFMLAGVLVSLAGIARFLPTNIH